MTYSLDFRCHVLQIKKEEGLSFAATAKRFKIGKNTLFLWSKNINLQLKRNKPATKIDMEALTEDIIRYPDAYHYERAARLNMSKSGIYWAMKRLAITYKKNTSSPQSQRRQAVYCLKKK